MPAKKSRDETNDDKCQSQHNGDGVFEVQNYGIQCDFGNLYGQDFVPYLQKPSSILLANGSEISVRMGGKIK